MRSNLTEQQRARFLASVWRFLGVFGFDDRD
jgi:hypothetical protein